MITAVSPWIAAPAAAAAGLIMGWIYFAMVRRTSELLAARSGWSMPALLTVGRAVIGFGVLAAAARLGAAPLLGALAGFLAARSLAVRRARRL